LNKMPHYQLIII